MLEILDIVEKELPRLLKSPEEWKSVFIAYEYPHVARIWRPWNGYRINLHQIMGTKETCLWHPHPWPSAVRVLAGDYEMGIGAGKESAKVVAKIRVPSCGGLVYEMTDPDGWHYVKPLDHSTFSLMITGKPWDKEKTKGPGPMRELTPEEWKAVWHYFTSNYPERI